MSDTRQPTSPATPAVTMDDEEARQIERIEALIGDPMPPDWRDGLAVQARQDHLSALAHMLGEAALDMVVVLTDMTMRGIPYDQHTPAMAAVAVADQSAEVYQALQAYRRETRRDDGGSLVHDALEFSAGATIAAMVVGNLDGIERKMHEDYQAAVAQLPLPDWAR